MANLESRDKAKLIVIPFFILSLVGILIANETGAVPGVTGDFGEPSCRQGGCHESFPLNAAGGTLTVAGVPAEYAPGQLYRITVTIAKSGQRRWGFELSARVAGSGDQAGTLVLTEPLRTQIRPGLRNVQYITHTLNGTSQNAPQGSWSFDWRAPATDVGPVRFSCAANAASDPLTLPLGDYIYTTTVTSNPQAPPAPSKPITALFSQTAVGGGYTTVFTVMNTGTSNIDGNLILSDQVAAGSSSFPISVPPGGTQFLTAVPRNPGDSTTSGWARLESTGGTVGGVGTFQVAQGGGLQSIAGVLASQPVNVATIPVDNQDPDRFTGFAIANHNGQPLRFRLVVLDEAGQVRENLDEPAQLNLDARGHMAVFLHQILPAYTAFRGSMVLVGKGGQSFAVVALVLTKEGLLTAIPVIPEKAPHVPN